MGLWVDCCRCSSGDCDDGVGEPLEGDDSRALTALKEELVLRTANPSPGAPPPFATFPRCPPVPFVSSTRGAKRASERLVLRRRA